LDPEKFDEDLEDMFGYRISIYKKARFELSGDGLTASDIIETLS